MKQHTFNIITREGERIYPPANCVTCGEALGQSRCIVQLLPDLPPIYSCNACFTNAMNSAFGSNSVVASPGDTDG